MHKTFQGKSFKSLISRIWWKECDEQKFVYFSSSQQFTFFWTDLILWLRSYLAKYYKFMLSIDMCIEFICSTIYALDGILIHT